MAVSYIVGEDGGLGRLAATAGGRDGQVLRCFPARV